MQSSRRSRLSLSFSLIVGLIAGCAAERGRDPFKATGELIALSGGEAGARNACFTCHGLRGEGDGSATPQLAALGAGYLQRQLRDYAIGLRPDPTMGPIAKALESEDHSAVAGYYAALPAPLAALAPTRQAAMALGATLYHAGDPARGLAPCASCHGDAGEGGGPGNPRLAGQPAAYMAEQLRRWARGIRRNDPRGQMLAISLRLSASEAEAVAGYAATLRPAIVQAAAPPEPSL